MAMDAAMNRRAFLMSAAACFASGTARAMVPRRYLMGAYGDAQGMAALLGINLDFTTQYGLYADEDDWRNCGAPRGVATWDLYTQWDGSGTAGAAAAAAGEYDRHYAAFARRLATVSDRVVACRINSEFNANGWGHDYAKHATSVQKREAMKRLCAALRHHAPKVAIDWNPTLGQGDPTPCYPGDDFIDIVGLDLYENRRWFNGGSSTRWRNIVRGGGPVGRATLQWLDHFAGEHRKLISFPEWASDIDDGALIANMAQWMADRGDRIAYHAYWNSSDALTRTAALSALPHNAQAFAHAFGNSQYTGYWLQKRGAHVPIATVG